MIDYIKLVRQSWEITWKYKILWIFGLFLGAVGVNFGGSGNLGTTDYVVKDEDLNKIKDFIQDHWEIILIVITILLVLSLICAILSVIARGGIIHAVNNIDEKKKFNFRESLKIGTHYFWRIFGCDIVTGLLLCAFFLIIFIPAIILFILNSIILGVILIIPAILMVFAVILILRFIIDSAYRFIVIRDKHIIDALKLSVKLIKSNIKHFLFYILISWALCVGIGIAALIAGAVVLAVAGLLAFVIYTISAKIGLMIFLGIAGVLIIGLLIIMNAITNTFFSSFFTLFWKQLTK